ncbi:uncharacterized protein LOC123267218 [Cotesia glomerata]|uniref:uncharacterized protein LOC123267218 n=1 Tax=Cotesia glomerata TaxID=32391 RepID=UPI001D0338FA|nr:uncharacterized protein LOC123267218 [Cotesia glomerata]
MANSPSVYKYKLVVFLSEKKSAKEIIDIVPNDWIYADGESDYLMCKFMPEEIYNEDNLKLLNDMVRECAKPCDDWPSYPIDIRGRARSYEEAEKLMDKLQYQTYAYSTDNEKRAKKKAEKDKELFKLKKLSPNKMNRLLNDATLNLSDGHRSNSGK